jgi:predicted nuclease of predicted toxin-antitoxin system
VIILADENLHRGISQRLAADGHDVAQVSDLAPSIADPEVLALAVERSALLVTNDLDFGELVYRGRSRHTGVLLLRLAEMPVADQAALVSNTLAIHGHALRHAFSVLDPNRLRIRGVP